jgi:hypothetical protein
LPRFFASASAWFRHGLTHLAKRFHKERKFRRFAACDRAGVVHSSSGAFGLCDFAGPYRAAPPAGIERALNQAWWRLGITQLAWHIFDRLSRIL